MNVRTTLIAVGVALTVGACGGTSNHNTAASSTKTTAAGSGTTTSAASGTNTTTAATPITTSAGRAAIQAACSLATPSQVQTLLGAPAAGAGQESDPQPNYKTCDWSTAPPTGGNVNSVRLAVIVKAPGEKGFGASNQAGTPAPVTGVGDNATFASQGGAARQFGESQLVANKGSVSVSIDVTYGGSIAHPNSNGAAIGEVAREVFTQLNA